MEKRFKNARLKVLWLENPQDMQMSVILSCVVLKSPIASLSLKKFRYSLNPVCNLSENT